MFSRLSGWLGFGLAAVSGIVAVVLIRSWPGEEEDEDERPETSDSHRQNTDAHGARAASVRRRAHSGDVGDTMGEGFRSRTKGSEKESIALSSGKKQALSQSQLAQVYEVYNDNSSSGNSTLLSPSSGGPFSALRGQRMMSSSEKRDLDMMFRVQDHKEGRCQSFPSDIERLKQARERRNHRKRLNGLSATGIVDAEIEHEARAAAAKLLELEMVEKNAAKAAVAKQQKKRPKKKSRMVLASRAREDSEQESTKPSDVDVTCLQEPATKDTPPHEDEPDAAIALPSEADETAILKMEKVFSQNDAGNEDTGLEEGDETVEHCGDTEFEHKRIQGDSVQAAELSDSFADTGGAPRANNLLPTENQDQALAGDSTRTSCGAVPDLVEEHSKNSRNESDRALPDDRMFRLMAARMGFEWSRCEASPEIKRRPKAWADLTDTDDEFVPGEFWSGSSAPSKSKQGSWSWPSTADSTAATALDLSGAETAASPQAPESTPEPVVDLSTTIRQLSAQKADVFHDAEFCLRHHDDGWKVQTRRGVRPHRGTNL